MYYVRRTNGSDGSDWNGRRRNPIIRYNKHIPASELIVFAVQGHDTDTGAPGEHAKTDTHTFFFESQTGGYTKKKVEKKVEKRLFFSIRAEIPTLRFFFFSFWAF